MHQEQDTCRICSGPGEPDQPLFYPCKCSGTIRYIHQDCLKTWLDHSKKSTCDVCKHPYAFTKVYAPDMPNSVPVTIIVRKFVEQVIAVVLFMLRATLVAFVWLTLLPYGTVLTWRLYFRMGNILSWWISLHPRLTSSPWPSPSNSTAPNGTLPLNGSNPLEKPLVDFLIQHYLRTLSTDIFTGQIIASLIVLAFLAVFLLREWIQQNARPGVFDDGPAAEVPVPEEPQPEAAPVQVNIDRDRNHGPAADVDAQWAPGAPDMVAQAPVRMARPVPDVPEDVRPADSSSSSLSSSSDSEGPRTRPAFTTKLEPPRPSFGRRKGGDIPGRRATRGITATRKRRIMEVEDPARGAAVMWETPFQNIELEQEGIASWNTQASERSAFYRPDRRSLYALGPKGGRFTSMLYQEVDAAGSSGSGTNGIIPTVAKSGQKRKADEAETEQSGYVASTQRAPSSSLGDFEFTFRLPASPPEESLTFRSASPLTRNDVSKPKARALDQSESSSSSWSVVDLPPRAEFLPPHTPTPLFSYPADNSMFLSTHSPAPPSSHSFEKGNRGARAERSYPLTPRPSALSSAPPPPFSADEDLPDAPRFQFTFKQPPQPMSVSFAHAPAGQLPRRPLLPTSAMPPVENTNAEATSSTGGTAPAAGLPSPRLAIYRPPEELLESGEYFGGATHGQVDERDGEGEEGEEEEDDDARFAYYFREPDPDDARDMPLPLLPDTDDDEDDEDAHDVRERREGDAAEAPADVPFAARDPALEVDAENADDERDQNLEEDLDGAMEAVGLRGPVFAVFQNAALMLFILNVSIGGGVWIPFTLGKTVVLLTLEPRRAVQILHLPIRAVRFVTDPSVDGVLYSLRLLGDSLIACGNIIYVWTLHLIQVTVGKLAQEWLIDFSQKISLLIVLPLTEDDVATAPPVGQSSPWKHSSNRMLEYALSVVHGDNSPLSSFMTSFVETPAFRFIQERFAMLGRHIRLLLTTAVKEWADLAEGDGTTERLWAILLGYAIVAFFAALYLNTITVGNVRSAGRAVRNAIRQQMIVLKVALFIVVELVMFPFGCGTMLDFSTLVLFPEASVESRVAFFLYAPITAAFYHWLIGTMFMYQFAILLATCRDILRPGCMWFIKDPQDPTFHPIRDILDRPTFAQLRKLCMSAMMYAVVISLGVGSIVWSLTAITPSMLPLRWKMREPLSEIPVDLLFVHLILPPTLHYFRPRMAVRRLMTGWWRWAARQLRLTSFMFGGRHHNEEYTPIHWTWQTLLPNNENEPIDMDATHDGGFRRAPAGDNIAFLRDKPALVQVDEHGMALDEGGRAIIWAQNAEAHQAGRKFQDDYTVVYVPPHFRRRIFLFILLFWLSGSTATVSAVALPILLGRAVFGRFISRHVHDGYSLIVGFYLLWWSWLVGTLIARIRIRRHRHEGSRRIRASWSLFLFKRIFVYGTKVAWLALWLGLVLPTLVSITVDLYLIIPLRFFLNPNFTPTIHVFESWATGLVLSKIIIRTQRARPGADLTGALDAIQQNGWHHPDPWAATRDFILPVGTGLVGMMLLPPLVIYGFSTITLLPWKTEDLFRLIYPSIFVAVAAFQFAMNLVGVFNKWTQSIRDKEFLVELRLRNLDNPRKVEKGVPPWVERAGSEGTERGKD